MSTNKNFNNNVTVNEANNNKKEETALNNKNTITVINENQEVIELERLFLVPKEETEAIERYYKKNPQRLLTTKMRGKMLGFNSISTSARTNPVCQARIRKTMDDIRNFSPEAAELLRRYQLPSKIRGKEGHITGRVLVEKLNAMGCKVCICILCYADHAQKWQHGARNKFSKNGYYLNTHLLEEDEIPVVSGPDNCFREEAEGDSATLIEHRNAIRIARKNPDIKIALWTKNPNHLLHAVMLEGGKPDNLVTVYSSPYVNVKDLDTFNKYNKKYPNLFNMIFTVWTKEEAERQHIDLNCCSKGRDTRCAECANSCYKFKENGVVEKNEILR